MGAAFDPAMTDHDDGLAPAVFVIASDDYHAKYVGVTEDGHQFFVTTPFTASEEFVARYLFDDQGVLVDAKIVPLGERPGAGVLPGNTFSFPDQEEAISQLLADLGPYEFGDITIAPFSITAFGHEFGMILHGPWEDDPDEEWYWNVTLEPGDFMAFSAPWDSGEYET